LFSNLIMVSTLLKADPVARAGDVGAGAAPLSMACERGLDLTSYILK
jgi:hypothetical protein